MVPKADGDRTWQQKQLGTTVIYGQSLLLLYTRHLIHYTLSNSCSACFYYFLPLFFLGFILEFTILVYVYSIYLKKFIFYIAKIIDVSVVFKIFEYIY